MTSAEHYERERHYVNRREAQEYVAVSLESSLDEVLLYRGREWKPSRTALDREESSPLALLSGPKPIGTAGLSLVPTQAIDAFLAEKLDFLREGIEQNRNQAAARDALAGAAVKEIESEVSEIETLLGQLRHVRMGTSPAIDTPRVHLVREAGFLKRERRETRVSAWRDLMFLEKELRGLLVDYRAIKRIQEMVA